MILLNKRFYWTNDFTEQRVLLNKRFHWTNGFTEQTILLNKRFYWTNDFIHSFIQFGANLCGKNLKLYFRGNLFSLVKSQIFVSGKNLFFQFGEFCVWEILNFYYGVKFFLFKGIFTMYEGTFFKLRFIFLLGGKTSYFFEHY